MIVNAATLSLFIRGLAKLPSIKKAWEATRSKLSLNTAYRLRKRIELRIPGLRSLLSMRSQPPPCDAPAPLSQTWLHLQDVVGSDDPVEAFQLKLHRHFLPN